jgi:hypothetical protein
MFKITKNQSTWKQEIVKLKDYVPEALNIIEGHREYRTKSKENSSS